MHACAPIRACIRIMRLCVSAYMFFRMHELACACVRAEVHINTREFLLQQYEFHNAPRHMNVYLNVAYISSVGGCAFRFMSAEVYAAFSACILSLQLWFMCVCVCGRECMCTTVCVGMYVYMCTMNTRFPLPRPAWFPQPDHKPPVSTVAPPSAATGFPEKNSV